MAYGEFMICMASETNLPDDCTGGHSDTQLLASASFQLVQSSSQRRRRAYHRRGCKTLEPEQLKVFNELPADSINADIQEAFTQLADDKSKPSQKTVELRAKTFRWPPKKTH